jgi:toxin ParE1/3/4
LSHAAFSELAEGDLVEIWLSIAIDQVKNADRFVEELRAQAQRLAEQPLMGVSRQDFGKEVRSFPHGEYLVIYRPTEFGVGIARIVHGARDLGKLVVPRT